jgi:cytochrome c-type biogenesis protein CcmH/NrfG
MHAGYADSERDTSMSDLWRIALIIAIDIAGTMLYIRARPILRMSHSWQLLTYIASPPLGLIVGVAGAVTQGWWYFVPLVALFTVLCLWLFAWGWLQQVALRERADEMLARQDARQRKR